MKTVLEQEDIEAIARRVVELIKPLIETGDRPDKYMTMKELAQYLGVAYSTIANNKKKLPHTYLNGTPLFKKSEIDAYLQQFAVKPERGRKFNERMEGMLKGAGKPFMPMSASKFRV